MIDEAEDKIRRAVARLSSIRKNLPDTPFIDESLVHEYSGGLRHLEDLGVDVAEFRVPEESLERRVMSKNDFGVTYAKERTMKRALFVTKLDAALGYLARDPGRGNMGFSKTG
jgi:hypothetical protein